MATKNFFVNDGLKVRGNTLLNGATYSDTALAKLHVKSAANGVAANLNNVNGLLIENSGAGNSNYAIKLATGAGNIFNISNAGNVGIGITTATSILHAVGPGAHPTSLAEFDTQSIARFEADSSTATSLYITEGADGSYLQVTDGATNSSTAKDLNLQPFGGSVGIGTTNPGTTLSIKGDTEFLDGDTGTRIGLLYDNGTEGILELRDNNVTKLSLRTAGASYFTGGNVGIGTTDPNEKLTVVGNISASGTIYGNIADPSLELTLAEGNIFVGNSSNVATADSTIHVDTSNSLVGIGTNSPSRELEIQGSGNVYARVTASTDNDSAALELNNNGNELWTLKADDTADDDFKITNNAGTALTIDTSKRVGVGTTGPGKTLHVYTSDDIISKFSSSDAGGRILINDSTTNAYINAASGVASIGQANGLSTSNVNILSNGNVGIGTTNPNNKMTIRSSSSALLKLDRTDASYGGALNFTCNNTQKWAIKGGYDASCWDLTFLDQNDTSRLTITQGGLVGIGTYRPTSLLHIDTGANSAANFRLGANRTVANAAVGQLIGDWNGTIVAKIALKTGDDTTNKDDGEIAFEVAAAGTTAEAMRIQNDGNVGIGIATPVQKLHITGSTLITNNNYHYGYTSGGAQATLVGITSSNNLILSQNNANIANTYIYGGTGNINLNPAGDVCVNSASLYVDEDVQIGATSTPDLILKSSDTGVNTNGKIYWKDCNNTVRASAGYETGSTEFIIDNTYSGGLYLKSNGTVGLTLNSAANVGIGTISPSYELDVVGSIYSSVRLGVQALNTNYVATLGGTTNNKLVLTGSSQPFIRFQEGTTDKAYIQWDSSEGLTFRNQEADNFNFIPDADGSVMLRLQGPDHDNWGMFYATENGGAHEVGILDGDGAWAARHVKDTSWEWRINNSTKMFLNSAGNVGIGTASPVSKLDVYGDGEEIYLRSNDYNLVRIIPRGTGANLDKGLISIFDTGTEDIRFDAGGNSWIAGGQFGVGTSSVSYPFEVKTNTTGLASRIWNQNTNGEGVLIRSGDVSCKTRVFQVASQDDTKIFTINSDNTVGIGVTNPTNRLVVVNTNTDSTPTALLQNSSTGDASLHFNISGRSYTIGIDNSDGDKFKISRNNGLGTTDRLTINGDGNVGIGTTNPGVALDVVGGLNVSGTANFSGTWTNFGGGYGATGVSISNTGNIQANGDLTVDGDAVVCGDLTVHGTCTVVNTTVTATTSAIEDNFVITSTDASSTSAPDFILYRNSASPAAGDNLGLIQFRGKNDAGSPEDINYVSLLGNIIDETDGTEDSKLSLYTYSAGTETETMTLRSGKVGIGTNDPSNLLQLYSSAPVLSIKDGGTHGTNATSYIDFEDNSSVMSRVGVADTAGTLDINNLKANSIRLQTNNSTQVTVTSAGNVGIGTTEPSQKLDVIGRVRSSYNSGDYFEIGSSDSGGFVVGKSGGTEKVNFRTYGDSFFTGGNVGIGTESPASKLDIQGSTNSSLILTRTSSGIVSNIEDASGYGALALYQAGGGVKAYITGNGSSYLLGGNLGIGTTSPNQKLEVFGNQRISNSGVLEFFGGTVYPQISRNGTSGGLIIDTAGGGVSNSVPLLSVRENGGTDFVTVLGSGNVGIGNASPTEKLEVAGNIIAKDSGFLAGTNGDKDGFVFHDLATGGGNYWGYKGFTSSSRLSIVTDGAERLTVISDGNVGIGTTSPSAELHINDASGLAAIRLTGGAASADGFQIMQGVTGVTNAGFSIYDVDATATRLVIDTNGNVGMGGITNPAGTLHLPDNGKLLLGYGCDLEIYHDGSNSWITNSGTGILIIGDDNGDVRIRGKSGEESIVANDDGAVELYYDNSKKFETVSNGAKLTGTAGYLFGGDSEILAGQDTSGYYFATGAGQNVNKPIFIGDNACYIKFKTSDAEVVRIDSNGNVGIGSTTPGYKLDVTSSSNTTFRTATTGTDRAEVAILKNSGTAQQWTLSVAGTTNGYSVADKYFYIADTTGGTTPLVIDKSGNVGIGSTLPNAPLDIYSDASDAPLRVGSPGVWSGINFRDCQGNQNMFFRGSTCTWSFGGGGSSVTGKRIHVDGGATIGANYDACTMPTNGLLVEGSVGIGTTTTASRLHVNGGSKYLGGGDWTTIERITTTEDNYALYVQSTGTNANQAVAKFIHSSTAGSPNVGTEVAAIRRACSYFLSNVGIGTTSPTQKLHVYVGNGSAPTDSNTHAVIEDSDHSYLGIYGGSTSDVGIHFGDSAIDARIKYENDNRKLKFAATGTTDLMTLDSTGLGIGTITPGAKLDVRGSQGYLKFDTSGSDGTIKSDYNLKLYADDTGDNSSGYQNIQFYTAGAQERVRIDAAGKVGIGTTAPVHKVDIYSDENIPLRVHRPNNACLNSAEPFGIGFSTRGDNCCSTTDTRAGIFSHYSGALFLATDTSNVALDPISKSRLYINNAGKISINTTSPDSNHNLTIANTANYGIRFTGTNATIQSNANLIQTVANNLYMRPGGAYCAIIDSGCGLRVTSGNVGIGTIAPERHLHVEDLGQIKLENNSTGNWAGIDLKTSGGTNDYTGYFGMLDSNGNFFIDVGSNGDDVIIRQNGETNIGLQGKVLVGLTTALNTANKLHVNNAIALGSSLYTFNQVIGNGANLELVSNANPANIGTNSNIIFKLGTSGGGGPNEAMRIVSTGNVGIGTTNPASALHIYRTAPIISLTDSNSFSDANDRFIFRAGSPNGGFFQWYDDSAGTTSNLMHIGATGNIGVGTTSPDAHIHVEKSSGETTVLTEVGANSTVGYEIKKTGSTTQHWRIVDGQTVNGRLEFYDATDSATRMTIDGDGNVGIGTVSPGGKLEISLPSGEQFKTCRSSNSYMTLAHGTGSTIICNGGTFQVQANGSTVTSFTVNSSLITLNEVVQACSQLRVCTTCTPTSNNFHVSSGITGSASKSSIAVVSVADNSTFYNGVAALHVINSGNRGTKGHSSGSDLLRLEFSDAIHTVFDRNGNVGIGTTAPGYELEVCGNVSACCVITGAVHERNLRTLEIKSSQEGTVLIWEDGKAKPCTEEYDSRVLGIAGDNSEDPIVMGAEPVLVTGTVNEGDFIVTSAKPGHGMAGSGGSAVLFGKVIAQALESGSGNSYTIKAMIRKL